MLVSFNISALVTNILSRNSIHNVPKNTIKLIEHCVIRMYLIYVTTNKYKGTHGLISLTSHSPHWHESFWKEDFEKKNFLSKPTCWFRYIDLTIWPYSKKKLIYLNNIYPNIKFTNAIKVGGTMPYFPWLLKHKNSTRRFHYIIYWKPTPK